MNDPSFERSRQDGKDAKYVKWTDNVILYFYEYEMRGLRC